MCERWCVTKMACQRRQTGTKRVTRASPVPQAPHLPHKVTVDITKGHACHAKSRSMSPSATPATQQTAAASTASNGNQARHQTQPSVISSTPATQSDGRCRHAPRLPRKVPRRPRRPPDSYHAKRRSMSPSATPAMQNDGRCHQVRRLPRNKRPRRQRRQTETKRVTRPSPVS